MTTELGWLIERQEGGINWYIAAAFQYPDKARYSWHWTADPFKALRFTRKADAENAWEIIRNHVGEGNSSSTPAVIVEHGFDKGDNGVTA